MLKKHTATMIMTEKREVTKRRCDFITYTRSSQMVTARANHPIIWLTSKSQENCEDLKKINPARMITRGMRIIQAFHERLGLSPSNTTKTSQGRTLAILIKTLQ
jgi:hypothetical protein